MGASSVTRNNIKKLDGDLIPSVCQEISIVSLNYCPNGGANQVCATEFDQDGNGLSESAGCWVTTISVHVRALVCISSKDSVPVFNTFPITSG